MVKNSANAEDMGLIPDGGRFNISWSNQACAPQLLSLCSAAWESQLLSPSATTAEACMSRACALQQKKSPQWEAHLPQRWVAPACHNQRKVHTATKTLHTQINKYFLKKEKTPRNKYMQNKNEYDISLMANRVGHLFVCLWKCLIKIFIKWNAKMLLLEARFANTKTWNLSFHEHRTYWTN